MNTPNNQLYWEDLAAYDYETAIAMFQSNRYLYVGFMCHQTIEKILKAYIVATKQIAAPYSHNLVMLAKNADLYETFNDQQKSTLDLLAPLNVEARYPTHKEKIMKSLNRDKCQQILENTKELQLWIKTKLS